MNDLRLHAKEEATGGRTSVAPAYGQPLPWLDKLEEWASISLLLVVLVAVSVQVIARYVLHAPLFWGGELARYTYVWMAFLAGAFVTGRRGHVRIDLLDAILPPRALKWLECFANFAVGCICLAVVVFSFDWLLGTARPKSPALRMPMIFLYGGVWLSFALMALHSFVTFYLVATDRVPATPPDAETYE